MSEYTDLLRENPSCSACVQSVVINKLTKGRLSMEKLLITIASGLVENKDAVTVDRDEPNDEGIVFYHLHVAPEDMGRVIGKQGRIAKAIRTVMRAGAGRINEKIMVEID